MLKVQLTQTKSAMSGVVGGGGDRGRRADRHRTSLHSQVVSEKQKLFILLVIKNNRLKSKVRSVTDLMPKTTHLLSKEKKNLVG